LHWLRKIYFWDGELIRAEKIICDPKENFKSFVKLSLRNLVRIFTFITFLSKESCPNFLGPQPRSFVHLKIRWCSFWVINCFSRVRKCAKRCLNPEGEGGSVAPIFPQISCSLFKYLRKKRQLFSFVKDMLFSIKFWL
jgi:hypothetical protein